MGTLLDGRRSVFAGLNFGGLSDRNRTQITMDGLPDYFHLTMVLAGQMPGQVPAVTAVRPCPNGNHPPPPSQPRPHGE